MIILTGLIVLEASCAGASAPSVPSPVNTPVSERTALDPSPAPTFPTTAVEFAICASGDGWVRPDDERQREYLLSLGGEFAEAAKRGATIAGETVGRDRGSGRLTEAWEYRILWPLSFDTVPGEVAFPFSGLWTASPDLSACDRDRVLTLIIDHRVRRVWREDRVTQVLFMDSAAAPGHWEVLEFDLPAGYSINQLGWKLLDEAGLTIAGCCQ